MHLTSVSMNESVAAIISVQPYTVTFANDDDDGGDVFDHLLEP